MSRQPLDSNNLTDSNENLNSNDETYLAERIVSTNHLNYLKPKIKDNRIKTTQYYQSDDELNEKRLNDETTNNFMANKVCMNISLSNLNRKQNLLPRNELHNMYESCNLDTDRMRSNNSTLSNYGNNVKKIFLVLILLYLYNTIYSMINSLKQLHKNKTLKMKWQIIILNY